MFMVLSFLIIISIFSGCNNENTGKTIASEKQLQELLDENRRISLELEVIQETVKKERLLKEDLNNVIDDLSAKLNDTSNELAKAQETSRNKSELRPLLTGRWAKLNEFASVKVACPIFAFPDDQLESYGIIYPGKLLKVLEYVLDDNWEEWALVRDQFAAQTGGHSVGFIKASYLTHLSDDYNQLEKLQVPDLEVEGIKVGDSLEKVISVFGNEYYFEADDYWFGIAYENLFFSLALDNRQQKVYEIHLRKSSYKVENELPQTYMFEGFKIGDKAIDAIEDFDEIYPEYTKNAEMLSDDPYASFIEFDVNEDYVIHVKLSEKDVDDETTIEGIQLKRKNWVY